MKFCRRRSIHFFILFFTVPFCLFIAEVQFSFVWNFYRNYYAKVVRRNIIAVRRSDLNIGIVVVVDKDKQLEEYSQAYLTVACYARIHNYELIVISFANNKRFKKICPHKDFMFRRHCALNDLLYQREDLDYVFFIDGDMGVVNPNHLIEEYISSAPRAELIFGERIFNYEIMSGAYIAKRTKFTMKFLKLWADYERKLPSSFHGTDNGAIHSVFLDVECGENSDQSTSLCKNRDQCTQLWQASNDYKGLSLYTSCSRAVLGRRNSFANGQLHLMDNRERDGYFAHDGWLTGNSWSNDDFLLHGWQNRRIGKRVFAGWHSPLASISDLLHSYNNNIMLALKTSCKSRKDAAQTIWAYKDTFMKPSSVIAKRSNETARQAHINHVNNLRTINSTSKT